MFASIGNMQFQCLYTKRSCYHAWFCLISIPLFQRFLWPIRRNSDHMVLAGIPQPPRPLPHTHTQNWGVRGEDYAKMTVNSLYGGNDSEETGSMHSTSCGGQSLLKPFESTADVYQMKTHVSSTVRLPIKNLNKLNHLCQPWCGKSFQTPTKGQIWSKWVWARLLLFIIQ